MPESTTHVAASMPVSLAADSDSAGGAVKALVSAFGVKYRIGWGTWHTIEASAFDASIAAQESLPLFWQHSWDYTEQPPIGHAAMSTSDDGLEIDGELYVDLDPSIARVHASMKAGAIREWSIGYRVLAARQDPDDERHLFVTEAEVLEASAVLRGANPETKTLEMASALLGRPPTDAEVELITAGEPLELNDPTPPAPADGPNPEPEQTSSKAETPDLDIRTVRRLYRL